LKETAAAEEEEEEEEQRAVERKKKKRKKRKKKKSRRSRSMTSSEAKKEMPSASSSASTLLLATSALHRPLRARRASAVHPLVGSRPPWGRKRRESGGRAWREGALLQSEDEFLDRNVGGEFQK